MELYKELWNSPKLLRSLGTLHKLTSGVQFWESISNVASVNNKPRHKFVTVLKYYACHQVELAVFTRVDNYGPPCSRVANGCFDVWLKPVLSCCFFKNILYKFM